MSHRSFAPRSLLLVLLCCLSLNAQEPAPPKKTVAAPEDSAVQARRKKAFELLLSVAAQLGSLRSGENRARIGSNLVDSLWDFDEKAARGLLATVQDDITAGLNDNDSDAETRTHTLRVFLQLRSDTLVRVAGHDPELAMTFLRATRPSPDLQLPYDLKNAEANLELRLADSIAARSPQLAIKLGRQALAKGFTPELKSVLLKVQSRDNDAGESFYQEIVEKLKRTNLAEDSAALAFAGDLARAIQPPHAAEQSYRDLLGLISASALANGCAVMDPEAEDVPQICYEAGSIFSQLEKYQGTEVTALQRWVDPDSDAERQAAIQRQDLNDKIVEGNVDEILALAEKYPESRSQVYWVAFEAAARSGDLSRARQLAAAAPSAEMRQNMEHFLGDDEKPDALAEQTIAVIQTHLAHLGTDAERASSLIAVASEIGRIDHKTGLRLLNEAMTFMGGIKPGRKRLQLQIQLAMHYSSLGSERGFAIMESLMPRLNELVSAAATLDGFDNSYLRDGEWNMSGQGGVGALLNELSQNAGYFAHLDLGRAATLAGQFERPEIRLMAQLKLAQAALRSQPTFSSRLHYGRVIFD
jgi:hypothetical protein